MLNADCQRLADLIAQTLAGVQAPKTPTMPLLAAESFATQLYNAADDERAAMLIPSQPQAAAAFLTLARYVVEIYSTKRNLTTLIMPNNRTSFRPLASLVLSYIQEIQRGAHNPLG